MIVNNLGVTIKKNAVIRCGPVVAQQAFTRCSPPVSSITANT